MFQGVVTEDTELMVRTMGPRSRPKGRAQIAHLGISAYGEVLEDICGVPLSELETARITLRIDEDHGNVKEVELFYNYKSLEDTLRVVKIGDAWYIDWFSIEDVEQAVGSDSVRAADGPH